MQHSNDPPGGALYARGRQPVMETPSRRSRSADGSRPQYKDARRSNLTPSPTRSSPQMAVPTAYGQHYMAPSEPTYHDVGEKLRIHELRAQQQSRSLSPAGPRRGTLIATPFDPYHRVRQDADPHQQRAEAYSRRYSRQEKVNRKQMTESLLMFSDAFDTASAMTGWSEQELIQKKRKKLDKKEKSYTKKKKNREARILNMPAALKRTNSSEMMPIEEKKRYYRGSNEPRGAMTSRGARQKRVMAQRKPEAQQQQQKKQWSIVPTLSRSSEMDSTQGSTENTDDISNPSVRRWIQSKQRRRKKESFPVLSSKSSEGISFPKRDAPGPVARKPSPPLIDPTPREYDAWDEPVGDLRRTREEKRSMSPSKRSPGLAAPRSPSNSARRSVNSGSPRSQSSSSPRSPSSHSLRSLSSASSKSKSPNNRSSRSKSPSRERNVEPFRASNRIPSTVYSGPEDHWMQDDADMNITPENNASYPFSPYGTAAHQSGDHPDDRSPTSVTSRRAYKKQPHAEPPFGRKAIPRSILRNSPTQPSTRRDGTYPLYRPRNVYSEGDDEPPRRIQARFSENVEQRTFFEDEDKYMSESDNEASFVNDYSDQGAFPIQERILVSEVCRPHQNDDAHPDVLDGQIKKESQMSQPHSREREKAHADYDSVRLGAVPRYDTDAKNSDIYSVGSPAVSEDSTKISKEPPPEGQGFTDVDGNTLSPIRIATKRESKKSSIDVAKHVEPTPDPQMKCVEQPKVDIPKHAMLPDQPFEDAYDNEFPPSNCGKIYKTSPVPPSTLLDEGAVWVNDENYDITDDEFENHQAEMAFMQVVAAVVIQTTFRRYLAVLTFERLVEEHFKSIAGPDIMDPIVQPSQRVVTVVQEPMMERGVSTDEEKICVPVSDPSSLSEESQSLHSNSKGIESKPHRPIPPLQNQKERIKLYIKCATNIQRVFRGWWIRDSLHVDHYCATLIQQTARGFFARNSFYYDMYRVILAQAHVRMILTREMAAERFACIVMIQSHVRAYQARMRTRGSQFNRKRRLAEYAAAVKIQAQCRAYLFQEKYLNVLADILIVQSVWRRWIANNLVVPRVISEQNNDDEKVLTPFVEAIVQQQRALLEIPETESPMHSVNAVVPHQHALAEVVDDKATTQEGNLSSHPILVETRCDDDAAYTEEAILPQQAIVAEAHTGETVIRSIEEMGHHEALGMWKKKKRHNPNTPPRSPKVSNRALSHHVEKPMHVIHRISATPSDEISSIDGRRSTTPSEFYRPLISPSNDASELIGTKPIEVSPIGERYFANSPSTEEQTRRLNGPDSGERVAVGSPYALSNRGTQFGQEQAQPLMKSHDHIRKHAVVASPDEPTCESSVMSYSWEEETRRESSSLDRAGLQTVAEQDQYEEDVLDSSYELAVSAARAALIKPVSFDSSAAKTSASSPARMPPMAAARQALMNPQSFDSESTKASSKTAPSPLSVPPKRKVKNSVAAFWEQKTANQPNPILPPAGGMYNSSR